MKPLYIYFQGINQVCLSGENDTAIRGCRYAPGSGKVCQAEQGEVIEEVLDLVLEGLESYIESKLFEVEKYLELANQETIPRDWVYLRFYDGATSYDWKSRIVGGRIEYLNHGLVDRDNESQWAKLYIKRINYWSGSRRFVPVFDAATADPATLDYIAQLDGHTDSGHKSYFGLDGHSSENDLPTPIELCFANQWSATAYNNITLSERVLRGTSRVDAGWIEGEDFSEGADATKTDHADAACSNGYYATFAWNSVNESQLATWIPTSAELAILRGQVQRGLMRLRDTNAATDLWLRLKVLDYAGSNTLAESLWMLVPTGTKYVELPPIAIPPGLAGYEAFQQVTVAIYVKKPSGGAADLDIDFVDFVPAESIRKLTYLNVAQTQGLTYYMVDSGSDEETYFVNDDDTKKITHVGTGNYLVIYPGYDSIVHYNHRAGGDASWSLSEKTLVIPYYQPRRRNL